MYCRNCGTELFKGAEFCTSCGLVFGNGCDFCPSCGKKIGEGKTCTHCGFDLTLYPSTSEMLGGEMPLATSPCPHCGKDTPSGTRYCAFCGEYIFKKGGVVLNSSTIKTATTPTSQAPAVPLTKGQKIRNTIIAILVAIILVTGIAYLIYEGTKKELIFNATDGGFAVVRGSWEGEALVIPSTYKDKPVTEVDNFAFSNYEKLETLVIPEGVKIIDNGAFFNCVNLKEVTLPSTLTHIGSNAFYNCENLVKVNYTGTVDEWAEIDFFYTEFSGHQSNPLFYANDLFVDGEKVTDLVLTTATKISAYAFAGANFESVTVPSTVNNIGVGAFYKNNKLKEITVPFVGESLTNTNNTHFGYIFGAQVPTYVQDDVPYSLKTVTITGGEYIGVSAFENCKNLTKVVLPNTLRTIDVCAFQYCNNLISITIPSGVTNIDGTAFIECNKLVEVYNLSSLQITAGYSDNSAGFYAKVVHNDINEPSILTTENDYVTFNDNGKKTLISYLGDESNIVVPSDVEVVYDYAFYENRNLTSVVIPDGVAKIGASAFSYCENLTSLSMPSAMDNIGNWAFANCNKLVSIVIPNGVTVIGDYAFNCCESLTSVTLPTTLEKIEIWAFSNCTSLTQIVIPTSVTAIRGAAFWGCTALTQITIPSAVKEIGSDTFFRCDSLSSIVFEDPNGWWYQTSSESGVIYNIAPTELSNPSTAATALTVTYVQMGLKKS